MSTSCGYLLKVKLELQHCRMPMNYYRSRRLCMLVVSELQRHTFVLRVKLAVIPIAMHRATPARGQATY